MIKDAKNNKHTFILPLFFFNFADRAESFVSYDLLRVADQQRRMVKGCKVVKRKAAEVYSFLNEILFCSVCCITGGDKLWPRVHDVESLARTL